MDSSLKICFATLMAAPIVALFSTTVKADWSPLEPGGCIREPEAYITPMNLAFMAYRGTFEKEGIPDYGVLESEFEGGKVTAKDIVQAAVTGCVLSNEHGVAGNEQYINDVRDALQDLVDSER